VGADIVRGVTNSPPYAYSFSTASATASQVVVTSMAAADDRDGGWAQTHGSTLATSKNLYPSIDEDQVRGCERNHKGQQVGYLRFGIRNPVRCL
jgi:hypothetical protein